MSLFTFVRERIVPINAVIGLSITLSLILDFLAPKAPFLAWVSYALAVVVLLVMLAELIKPEAVSRWLENATQGAGAVLKKMWMGQRPAWRSPAWQTAALLAVAVLILGQVSKARAQEGGWLASRFTGVANAQAAWLDLKKDTETIKEGMNELRVLGKYHDANHALGNGDVGAIRAFMDKGQPLPPANTATDYALASGLSHKRPDRLELLALYVKDGFDINQRGKSLDLMETTPKAIAEKLEAWGKASGIRYHPLNCELTLMHVATITGDEEAIKWLTDHGASSQAVAYCIDGKGGKSKPFVAADLANAL